MYYTIYKITNQIDGKYYIGSHKTRNLDDNYMGSGKYLKHAQQKYGLENFKKEILFIFESAEEMYAKEAEIVNEDFLTTENTYNLKIGGFGGFDYLNSDNYKNPTHTTEHSHKMTKRRLEIYDKNVRKTWSLKGAEKTLLMKVGIHKLGNRGSFDGKKHTDDTKKIMSQKAKERLKDPKQNSQYGTMWITDGFVNKKIDKSHPIPLGWRKGRVIK